MDMAPQPRLDSIERLPPAPDTQVEWSLLTPEDLRCHERLSSGVLLCELAAAIDYAVSGASSKPSSATSRAKKRSRYAGCCTCIVLTEPSRAILFVILSRAMFDALYNSLTLALRFCYLGFIWFHDDFMYGVGG